MPVVGGTIRQPWVILDADGVEVAGMVSPTNVELRLRRDNGTQTVDATETVTLTDHTGGDYDITFTPVNAELYTLFLRELNPAEPVAPITAGRRYWWTYEVLAVGAVYLPAFSNAFCGQSDVERWTQLAFNSTSKPTTTQVAAFAQARAGEIRAAVATEGWTIAPGNVGYDVGSYAEDLLREANAIAAAADAYLAKFVDVDPAQTQKAIALLEEYQRRLERLVGFAVTVAGQSDLIRSPMTEGELTLKSETPVEDTGLRDAITMDREF